ncbi:hypothetical protein EDC31_101370 [Acidomonas methanolica]|nr:hypothetical protein EDC31_101370 [Acidomonas methanolica]
MAGLSSAGRDLRGHALELPPLADPARRHADHRGRERLSRQTRDQHTPSIGAHAGTAVAGDGRAAGRVRRRPCDQRAGLHDHCRPADRGRHGDGQRGGWQRHRRAGRTRSEEDRARTRRRGPVHRAGRRRSRRGRAGGRYGAVPEFRPDLHRRQAADPRSADRRRVHPTLRGRGRGAQNRRSHGRRDVHRPDGARGPAARTRRSGPPQHRGRSAAADRRQTAGRSRRLLCPDDSRRCPSRHGSLRRGVVRPRRLARRRGGQGRRRHPRQSQRNTV